MTGTTSATSAHAEAVGGEASGGTAGETAPARMVQTHAFETHAFEDFSTVSGLLDGLEGSAFQSPHWLSAWFEVMARDTGIETFLVVLREPGGGVAAALPLVRRKEAGLAVLEFPDLGVSDYAAPLMRRAAHQRLPEIGTLWPLLLAALPAADLLRFTRLAPLAAGMANPFYHHPSARRNRLSGWALALPATWAAYLASLSPSKRDKLRKIGRQFDRLPGSERIIAGDVETGLAVLADLERMQIERIGDKGLEYRLDQPRIAAFYRRLVETGLPTGQTMLTALKVGGRTVAANFNVIAGGEMIDLRVANLYGEWSRRALGLVVTECAIAEAQKRGLGTFDFAMGNYEFKRRFGAVEMPLKDIVVPLSPKGWPRAALWHMRHWVSTSPLLLRLWRRRAE